MIAALTRLRVGALDARALWSGSYEYDSIRTAAPGLRAPKARSEGIRNCPHGKHGISPMMLRSRRHLQRQTWRSRQEVETLSTPGLEVSRAGTDPSPYWDGRFHTAAGARARTYVNPFAAADPGEPERQRQDRRRFNGRQGQYRRLTAQREHGLKCDVSRLGMRRACAQTHATWTAATTRCRKLYTMVIRLSEKPDPLTRQGRHVELGYRRTRSSRTPADNIAGGLFLRIATATIPKQKGRVRDGVLDSRTGGRAACAANRWFYDHTAMRFSTRAHRLILGEDDTMPGA